jgi:hypothetical protein
MSGPGAVRSRRRRWVLPAAVLVAAACALGVLALALSGPGGSHGGASGRSTEASARAARTASPSAGSSALQQPRPAAPAVRRGPLCAALQNADVRAALGGPVARRTGYAPGQRVLLAPGVRDVSSEYACVFRARTGAQARVWVFAEPVTRQTATVLVRRAARATGCRPAAIAEGFGSPSAGTLCPGPSRPGRDLVVRGLFGDAYLSCELVTTGSETTGQALRRADSWCAGVAGALGAAG